MNESREVAGELPAPDQHPSAADDPVTTPHDSGEIARRILEILATRGPLPVARLRQLCCSGRRDKRAFIPVLLRLLHAGSITEGAGIVALSGAQPVAPPSLPAPRRTRRWTAEEDAAMQAEPAAPASELAARLGRTVAAVRRRRGVLQERSAGT